MKKTIISALTVISFLLFTVKPASAQNQSGQLVFSGGVGYSLIFSIIKIAENQQNAGTSTTITNTPAYNGTIDYALGNIFSMGFAVTYQAEDINYINYINTQTGLIENPTETVSRLNFGLRMLFHFTHGDRFDGYTGFRLGLSHWVDNNNANDTGFSVAKGNLNLPSIQLLIGLKGYITDNFGLHFEFAVGTPYLAEFGINYRLGETGGSGRKE